MSAKNTLIPMVEIFETVEGEGLKAGFPTVFVRLFGCNLRCTWCDTPYSYPPHKAERTMTIEEITAEVSAYGAKHICLTGGEPLLYKDRSAMLIESLLAIPGIVDLHIETNGAIDLTDFMERFTGFQPRYIMDYKLHDSGERNQMIEHNLELLRSQDELKFVIGSERDFYEAKQLIEDVNIRAQILFSPVWETMPPEKLVKLLLHHRLYQVKLNMQLHKIIWDPAMRGV